MFADPGFVVAQPVQPLEQLDIAIDRQRRVFPDPVERCQEDAELHAAMGHSGRYYAWVPRLSRHYRVVRMDLRGHGASGVPPATSPAAACVSHCQTDADCPSPNDACGSFGELDLSFAVVTGPRTCSNKTSQSCLQRSDCQFCSSNKALSCQDDAACQGTCVSSVCAGGSFNGLPCSTNVECRDTCSFGTCSGCPPVQVGGTTTRIVNITLRVISIGSSDLRFVVSPNPSANACALRNDTIELSSVGDFCPRFDLSDPVNPVGTFRVTGTK
jgi:hypothetical protein